MLYNTMEPGSKKSDFPMVNTQAKIINQTPNKLKRLTVPADSQRVFWADLTNWGDLPIDSSHAGFYSFSPTNPINFTHLTADTHQPLARNGVQYANGHIYAVYCQLYFMPSLHRNFVNVYYSDYDTKTWEGTTRQLRNNGLEQYSYITTQADDGTVYGIFSNSSGNKGELATVDFSKVTTKVNRETIGAVQQYYRALGITEAGQLYGIAADGNLYKIDKTTAEETLVGPTGLTLTNSKRRGYFQTGAIDQMDDKFYWCAVDSGGNRGLYDVNLETGHATLISDMEPFVQGMVIPAPTPKEGAPAIADTAWISIKAPELSGKLNFTAPSKTYSGEDLSGELTYKLIDVTYKHTEDSLVTSGTATAGSTVSTDVTFKNTGLHKVSLTFANANGESQKYKFFVYVGYDSPNPVANVKAVKDSLSKQKVNITWTAPQGGINGGEINTAQLTYTVYRVANGDTVAVADNVVDTQYVDEISVANIAYYNYGVKAVVGSIESTMAWTGSGVIVGDSIDGDWVVKVKDSDIFPLFKIIDANNDGKTWTSGYYGVVSNFSANNGNDDWLVTPALSLKNQYVYTVALRIRNGSDSRLNTFEVKYGKADSVEAITNQLIDTTTPSSTWTIYKKEIVPNENGNYYIGIHDNTEASNMFQIYVDSVYVVRSFNVEAPDSVTNLKVVPGNEGALSATVTFNVPELLIDEDVFETVDSIQIKRNGELIATLLNKGAGTAVSYIDNEIPTNGIYKYEITPFIGNMNGRKTESSAFVGKDVPAEPQNIRLIDNGSNVLAKWERFPVVGSNGGYVNPEEVNVSLFERNITTSGVTVGNKLVTSANGDTTAIIQVNPETNGSSNQQALYYLLARADNNEGSSNYIYTYPVIVGPTIQLPYKESFINGNIDNGFAWTEGNNQFSNNSNAAGWLMYSDISQDDDNGSLVWSPYVQGRVSHVITTGDETSFNLPKVSVNGATNPKLYFYVNSIKNDEAKLKVLIAKPDGSEDSVAVYDLSTTTEEGWSQKVVDLANYKSEKWIMVKLRGIATGSNVYVGVDNINIFDQPEHNLAVKSITAPTDIRAGKSGKVDVVVENYGSNTEQNAKVVLFVDNQPTDTVTIASEMGTLDVDTVSFNLTAPVSKKKMQIKAQVFVDQDANSNDDVSETKEIAIIASLYTKVADLSAIKSEDGVELAWTKPIPQASLAVTEDFEDYNAFDTELGDWRLIDNDKGLAGMLFEGYPYPGQGTAFAFDAFNPTKITSEFDVLQYNPGLAAHSGSQFAGAPYARNRAGRAMAANNWIISPELTGNKQTIKFYALNIAISNTEIYDETFDVLYSLDGNDFTKIETDTAKGATPVTEGANWTEFNVELPDSAKYFAIHHTTRVGHNYLFGIDDISFERATPGVNDSIIGYNIYLDGEKIASVKGDELAYTDEAVDEGAHVYNVTVVYQSKDGDVNESGFSNDASITVTGIEAVEANAEGTYDVYTIDGKVVRLGAKSLNGLSHGVYIINDRQYIIK